MKQEKQILKLKESQLIKLVKENVESLLKEWGFPDDMDYNVENADSPIDELQKYTDADIKSTYDPYDIANAFKSMAKSHMDINVVNSIGQAILFEDGLTEKDLNRKINAIKEDYRQARMRVKTVLNLVNKDNPGYTRMSIPEPYDN